MPKKESEPVVRQNFWIYAEDAEWLKATFGKGSESGAGKSAAVRAMIRAFRKQIEAKAEMAARRPGGISDAAEFVESAIGSSSGQSE